MAKIQRYPFYDTARLQTTAGTIILFNVSEGQDATHQSQDTNMRNGGSWVESESVSIDCINVYRDGAWIEDDIPLFYQQNFLKVLVNQENVLQLPIREFMNHDAFNGVVNQGSAGDFNAVGQVGMGFKLDHPILVGGGVNFRVELHQVTPIATANSLVKVSLNCVLTTKMAGER